jgi:hypothetical protein
MKATRAEVAALPGVSACQAVNGAFLISLTPGTDRRDFLRKTLDRYDVESFSDREPELVEIYLSAVEKAGIETRDIA